MEKDKNMRKNIKKMRIKNELRRYSYKFNKKMLIMLKCMNLRKSKILVIIIHYHIKIGRLKIMRARYNHTRL